MMALTGSIVGREHVRVGRNNQDGAATAMADGRAVVVVTDGCSSCAYSEVGARLGAAWLVRFIAAAPGEPNAIAEGAAAGLERYLAGLAVSVSDYLLFGFLAAVIDARWAFVFGVGDGVYAIDGAITSIDPGPDNAPPYVAYGLLGIDVPVVVHVAKPAIEVTSIVVATDGALDLPADHPLTRFGSDDAFARNPSLIEKRLRLFAERRRALRDDTTIGVLR